MWQTESDVTLPHGLVGRNVIYAQLPYSLNFKNEGHRRNFIYRKLKITIRVFGQRSPHQLPLYAWSSSLRILASSAGLKGMITPDAYLHRNSCTGLQRKELGWVVGEHMNVFFTESLLLLMMEYLEDTTKDRLGEINRSMDKWTNWDRGSKMYRFANGGGGSMVIGWGQRGEVGTGQSQHRLSRGERWLQHRRPKPLDGEIECRSRLLDLVLDEDNIACSKERMEESSRERGFFNWNYVGALYFLNTKSMIVGYKWHFTPLVHVAKSHHSPPTTLKY